jgi:hypothetical protein
LLRGGVLCHGFHPFSLYTYSQSHFSCTVGGHPRTKFFFKKIATQPIQPDVQAEGVDWIPTPEST